MMRCHFICTAKARNIFLCPEIRAVSYNLDASFRTATEIPTNIEPNLALHAKIRRQREKVQTNIVCKLVGKRENHLRARKVLLIGVDLNAQIYRYQDKGKSAANTDQKTLHNR